jgi:hypothetical protein
VNTPQGLYCLTILCGIFVVGKQYKHLPLMFGIRSTPSDSRPPGSK